jgi:hypothetical protein
VIIRLEMLCMCSKYTYSPSRGTWALALRGTMSDPPMPVAGDRVEYRLSDPLITLRTSGSGPLLQRVSLDSAKMTLTPQLGGLVRVDLATTCPEAALGAPEQEALAEELALVLEAVVDDDEDVEPLAPSLPVVGRYTLTATRDGEGEP